MKKIIFVLIAAITASIWILSSCSYQSKNNATSDKVTTVKEKVIYSCEMDKDVKSDKPGKCPKCGMELVKQA